MFGEGQMVIEEAIVDEKSCSKVNEFCTPYLGIVCCEGLTCNVPQVGVAMGGSGRVVGGPLIKRVGSGHS